jgi:hypothetical protein
VNRRRFLRTAAAFGAATIAVRPARAQDDDRLPPGFDRPDERGEVWAQVEYDGTTAYCPIPRSLRKKNEGGSDGAGLCVIASQVTDGRYQQIAAQVEELWRVAKTRDGGYWPERLKRLMAEVAPDLPYKSYEGTDVAWMEGVLKSGIPIGVTYGTGRGYQYQQIAHMVSLVHLDSERAGIIDNNFPGFVAWMPLGEFKRRFILGSDAGWAFYLDVPAQPAPTPKPSPNPVPGPVSPGGLDLISLFLGFFACAAGVAGGVVANRLGCHCPERSAA